MSEFVLVAILAGGVVAAIRASDELLFSQQSHTLVAGTVGSGMPELWVLSFLGLYLAVALTAHPVADSISTDNEVIQRPLLPTEIALL